MRTYSLMRKRRLAETFHVQLPSTSDTVTHTTCHLDVKLIKKGVGVQDNFIASTTTSSTPSCRLRAWLLLQSVQCSAAGSRCEDQLTPTSTHHARGTRRLVGLLMCVCGNLTSPSCELLRLFGCTLSTRTAASWDLARAVHQQRSEQAHARSEDIAR